MGKRRPIIQTRHPHNIGSHTVSITVGAVNGCLDKKYDVCRRRPCSSLRLRVFNLGSSNIGTGGQTYLTFHEKSAGKRGGNKTKKPSESKGILLLENQRRKCITMYLSKSMDFNYGFNSVPPSPSISDPYFLPKMKR